MNKVTKISILAFLCGLTVFLFWNGLLMTTAFKEGEKGQARVVLSTLAGMIVTFLITLIGSRINAGHF